MDMTRQPNDVEFHEAFASLRAAKNWFWWLLLLAVVINLASFVAVRFYPLLTDSPSFKEDVAKVRPEAAAAMTPTTMPAATTEPATTQPAEATSRPFPVNTPPSERAQWEEQVYQNLGWVLPLAKAMGLIMAVLLAVSLAYSLTVSLSGRLGGAGFLASSFVWSIVLAALFVPWSDVTGIVVPGVLFTRPELVKDTAHILWGASPTLPEQVLYYARFLGYPVLALLIMLSVQVKYARGFREIAVEVEAK